MQETQVQPLGWEDPVENVMAIHSSILAWGILWTEELCGLSPWGHKESDKNEQLTTKTYIKIITSFVLYEQIFYESFYLTINFIYGVYSAT